MAASCLRAEGQEAALSSLTPQGLPPRPWERGCGRPPREGQRLAAGIWRHAGNPQPRLGSSLPILNLRLPRCLSQRDGMVMTPRAGGGETRGQRRRTEGEMTASPPPGHCARVGVGGGGSRPTGQEGQGRGRCPTTLPVTLAGLPTSLRTQAASGFF